MGFLVLFSCLRCRKILGFEREQVDGGAYSHKLTSSLGQSAQNETEDDVPFWNRAARDALGTLMQGANYNPETQQDALDFFSHHIAPYLGPSPVGGRPFYWKSFMTDDFSPLEYSWSWERSPKIRYSFEPIGSAAGTDLDRFNRTAPLECAYRLERIFPNSDWRWFHHFARCFYQEDCFALHETPTALSSSSSIFLAFDIGSQDVLCKAYLIPVKAEQTGRSRFDVLNDAIEEIEREIELPAYRFFKDYMQRREKPSPWHIIGVAVDCFDPALAKLKIYFRSRATSFRSVVSILTLDGTLTAWSETAVKELRELWHMVLGLPADYGDEEELQRNSHETSGILYNYDVKARNAVPDTKVYIPVKHYGQNDRAVAQGLTAFLHKHGRSDHCNYFLETIDKLCTYRSLDEGPGFQTYIACAVKKEQLSLTSYFSAEIYHPGRWIKRTSSFKD